MSEDCERSARGPFGSKKENSNGEQTQQRKYDPVPPRQLRFLHVLCSGDVRLAHAIDFSFASANPCETTFIGALSGSAPSTLSSQRVSPESSSRTFVNPSLA